MEASATLEPQATRIGQQSWSRTKRLAFRFCFIYFTLYCLSNQIINTLFIIPSVDVPDLDTLWPIRPVIFWVGAHIFRTKLPLVYSGSGSGDKVFDWVTLFVIAVAAVTGAAIWSWFDRQRQNYDILYRWFWLFIRLCLAGQLVTYGLIKAVPLQMPRPYLSTLTEPFGNFSPMGVLWSSIGSAEAYQIFAGCAELGGGILLMFPRTATIGALVALADMVEIFLLNMTYDVPVKLLSFHLILMSLLLLGPNLLRMTNFFLLARASEPASPVTLPLRSSRALSIVAIAQVVLWVWFLGNNFYGDWEAWHQYGPGRPKPPLYGIWEVKQVTVDGRVKAPLLADREDWRRIIIEFPGAARIQLRDDSSKGYAADIDEKKHSLSLTKGDDKNWKASFTFVRPVPDQLKLDGTMAGLKTEIELKREDETKFVLNSRGFHWVQDYPFNR